MKKIVLFALLFSAISYAYAQEEFYQEEKKTEIHFIGQDSSQHTLKEYNVEGHPRYLYYELDNSENNEVVNNNNQTVLQINNKGEFKPDDKIPDIDMLVLDN